MKFFLDTCDLNEIKMGLNSGICDGVTTNPSMYGALGIGGMADLKKLATEIANHIFPRPLSVEVLSDTHGEMLAEGMEIASWAENICVKIPVTGVNGESHLPVIYSLAEQGIQINATCMMTVNQAILAAKAGAKYLSILAGRVDDEGGDAIKTLTQIRQWLDFWGASCGQEPEILVASVRNAKNVNDWMLTGAHAMTVPPGVIKSMLSNARTKETVDQFMKAIEALRE